MKSSMEKETLLPIKGAFNIKNLSQTFTLYINGCNAFSIVPAKRPNDQLICSYTLKTALTVVPKNMFITLDHNWLPYLMEGPCLDKS
jgi:hypothetical protein